MNNYIAISPFKQIPNIVLQTQLVTIQMFEDFIFFQNEKNYI
jgi:hypothetical protein